MAEAVGGGDSEELERGEGSGDAPADTSTTTTSAGGAMDEVSAAVGDDLDLGTEALILPMVTVDSEVACESGDAPINGSAEMTDSTNFTFTVTVGFSDCDGVNGDLTVSGTGQFLGLAEGVTFEADYGGSLGANGCEVSFDNLHVEGTAAVSGALGECVVSGTATADCTEDGAEVSVTCTWDSVDCDDNAGFEAGCGLM